MANQDNYFSPELRSGFRRVQSWLSLGWLGVVACMGVWQGIQHMEGRAATKCARVWVSQVSWRSCERQEVGCSSRVVGFQAVGILLALENMWQIKLASGFRIPVQQGLMEFISLLG